MQRAQGFAEQGARVVWTAGQSSQTLVQESAPFALIQVYVSGTTTLATLYADNNTPPTPLANPFTANENGYWWFYAPDGRYDVMIEAPDWTWTKGDITLQDVYSWSKDVNANGHWLRNLGGISFVNNLNPACASQIWLDQNCNLLITGAANMSLSPTGDMRIAGCLTTQCIHLNNGVCQSTITFDAGCRVEITGAGLSVDGYLNIVGGSQFDGPIAFNGPMVTDLNANGHSIVNVGFIGTAGIHLIAGACQAEIGFDANCNIVFYGNVMMNNNICAPSYCINGTQGSAGALPPYTVINGDGQFVGHGVAVHQYGMEAAYLQLDGTSLSPGTTVLSVFGPGGSTAAVRIHGEIDVDGGVFGNSFGIYQGGASPILGVSSGTFTTADGKTATVRQGLIISLG